jgi:hypothetical protein
MKFVKGRDYTRGDKYQTTRDHAVGTGITLPRTVVSGCGYVVHEASGRLTVRSGYCWDGPSGPTFDTAATMRGSLFHDAGYDLMSEGLLDVETHREPFDRLLHQILIEDGAWRWRARLWLWAVRRFARRAAVA